MRIVEPIERVRSILNQMPEAEVVVGIGDKLAADQTLPITRRRMPPRLIEASLGLCSQRMCSEHISMYYRIAEDM